jgi:hypothetical protein
VSQEYGDAPIENRMRRKMNAVARELDARFNPDRAGDSREVGFVLLVFPFGEAEGRCNYISNGADRIDVLTLLREQATRFAAQLAREDDLPAWTQASEAIERALITHCPDLPPSTQRTIAASAMGQLSIGGHLR